MDIQCRLRYGACRNVLRPFSSIADTLSGRKTREEQFHLQMVAHSSRLRCWKGDEVMNSSCLVTNSSYFIATSVPESFAKGTRSRTVPAWSRTVLIVLPHPCQSLLQKAQGHEQFLPGHEQFLLSCHIRARVFCERHKVTNSSCQVTNSSYFIVTRVPEPVGKEQVLRSGPPNKRPMTKLHVNK